MSSNFLTNLDKEGTDFAEYVFQKITSKRGKRAGRVYLSSKKEWRNNTNNEMASIYYVWRTLSFRLAENIMLPLQSDKYLECVDKKKLDAVVDYIGFKYYPKYGKYKESQEGRTTI